MKYLYILFGFSFLLMILPSCPGDLSRNKQDSQTLADYSFFWIDSSLNDAKGERQLASVDGMLLQDADPKSNPDAQSSTDDIGKACLINANCKYQLCATNTHTNKKFCTKICNPCLPDPCPSGSGCQDAGQLYICAPDYPNTACKNP